MGGPLFQSLTWVLIGLLGALLVAAAVWIVRNQHQARRAGHGRTSSGPPAAGEETPPRDNWPAWETTIHNALMQHGWVEEYFMSAVPAPLRVPAMRRYVQEHPDDALVLIEDPPRIELVNRQRLRTFLRSWKAAWELVESEENFGNVVQELAAQLCDVLGFVHVDEEQRTFRSLHAAVVRAPALRLKVPPRFPIIFVRRREGDQQDLADLRSLMSILDMTSYFALIIDLNDFADRLDPRKNLKNLVRDMIHDFIVLDGQDLRQILIARDPGQRLVEIILQQVDLTVISPYVTSGPVPRNMFFGRDHELKTVLRKIDDTSFALIGGRKIGKTSTLTTIYRLMRESRDPQHILYLDCQSVTDAESFFEAASTLWRIEPALDSPESFRRYMVARGAEQTRSAGQVSHPVVVLLDEIDAFLSHDVEHDGALFRVFRALSQERRCRFVLCGERVLYNQLHAADSPMFNFCDVIQLGYLKEHAARRIILEPMQTMGVLIQNQEDVVYEIIRLSSCHPNLVQYLCQQLILEANERHSRLISPADLDRVRHSSAFHEYFIEVTWGNTTPLEKAITLLISDSAGQGGPARRGAPAGRSASGCMSLSEIQDILDRKGFDVPLYELEQAIDGLRLYSILIKEGQQYRFASDVFAEIVRESQEIEILLNGLRDQVQPHS